jgi:hypothetical protein
VHDVPVTVGDTPKKIRHASESRELHLAMELATTEVAPMGSSRAMSTNRSSGARPGSGLHQCGKGLGWRRVDLVTLGRGHSLDGPRGAPVRGGLMTFAQGHNKYGSRPAKSGAGDWRGARLSYLVFMPKLSVLIVRMNQDQLFHTYGQKCSQITKRHEHKI